MQRALASEAIGTFFLLACVVGSGIMAERLAGGNMAVALLGNTIATGAMLYVLITIMGPVSGAHFNPAVTLALWLEKRGVLSESSRLRDRTSDRGHCRNACGARHVRRTITSVVEKLRTGPSQWFQNGLQR